MTMMHMRAVSVLALLLAIGGCQDASFYRFIPTPRMYLESGTDPFDAITSELCTPAAEVIYCTDRQPLNASARGQEYGYQRSRSMALGTMNVHFGKNLSWERLLAESRSANRSRDMMVSCSDIRELARYAPTPEALDWSVDPPRISPEVVEQNARADEAFRKLLSSRLALTTDKTVYLFVHGYHCEFEWGSYVIAQLWHFMGRSGVPVAYSWPAARPGLLRGYQYDRESGEFTVHHLKQFLELVASSPDVESINIISHSRGTDVLTSALRELRYKFATPEEAGRKLKLGVVVLAAADLDAEVASQRVSASGVIRMPKLMTLYVSREDSALSSSTWMFDSRRRVGMLRPEDLKAGAIEALQRFPQFEVVDARLTVPKLFSHSYFFAHSAGNSDLILLLRDGRRAGAAHGRPLERDATGFWILGDNYLRRAPAPIK